LQPTRQQKGFIEMKQLPQGFDSKNQHIMIAFIERELSTLPAESRRFVKVASLDDPMMIHEGMEEWVDAAAPQAWLTKYGELPALEELRGLRVHCPSAAALPYDGPSQLTEVEQSTIYRFLDGVRVDLTMSMLYVMIEGFGWRPGACALGQPWPTRDALIGFHDWFEGDDPEGSLLIALSLLSSGPDGESTMAWGDLNALAKDVHREAKSLRVS